MPCHRAPYVPGDMRLLVAFGFDILPPKAGFQPQP
jgi:hypothetical protein